MTENQTTARTIYVRLQDPKLHLDLDVEFEAASGVTVVFGPSGAGKTTILDCIAGLRSPHAGWVRVVDDVLFDSVIGKQVAPEWRHFGYVFQSPSLFPHLTAEENVTFGLGRVRPPQQRQRARAMLESLGALHLADRKPHQISGGEQGRVALARTLVTNPRVLLLDEPLTGLDSAAKDEVVHTLRTWIAEHQVPTIYVTHAIDEVFSVAEQVLVLDRGKIVQRGSAREVLASESARILRLLS